MTGDEHDRAAARSQARMLRGPNKATLQPKKKKKKKMRNEPVMLQPTEPDVASSGQVLNMGIQWREDDVVDAGNAVFCIDAKTGHLLWTRALASKATVLHPGSSTNRPSFISGNNYVLGAPQVAMVEDSMHARALKLARAKGHTHLSHGLLGRAAVVTASSKGIIQVHSRHATNLETRSRNQPRRLARTVTLTHTRTLAHSPSLPRLMWSYRPWILSPVSKYGPLALPIG